MAIRFAVLVVGVLGLISLFAGNPSFTGGWTGDEPVRGRRGAGALAAWPLARVISPIGAAIVCAGLASLGLLMPAPFAAVVRFVREERDERDHGREEGPDARSRAADGRSRAFGLTDDVIVTSPRRTTSEAATETIASVHQDPAFPSEPALPAMAALAREPSGRVRYQLPAGPVRTAPPPRGLARRTRWPHSSGPAVRRRRPGCGGHRVPRSRCTRSRWLRAPR